MANWNGGVLGVANNPTQLLASGRWSLPEVFVANLSGNWPSMAPPSVEYLVIAGGGGGGGGYGGAGGGAGGYRTSTLSITSGVNYTITVGGGGGGVTYSSGTDGSPSVFSTIT